GAKGEGRFARISWDEALGEIAARWTAIIERDGPQAIWPYQGTGSMGILQGVAGCGRRLWNVLGVSRHVMTICTIAGGAGTGYTLGHSQVGMDPETLSASWNIRRSARPRSPGCRASASSRSASAWPRRGRPASAWPWACSVTAAAAWPRG